MFGCDAKSVDNDPDSDFAADLSENEPEPCFEADLSGNGPDVPGELLGRL